MWVGGLAAVLTLTGGCSSPTPLTKDDAAKRYDAALDAVAKATGTAYGVTWRASGGSSVGRADGTCTYWTRTLVSDRALAAPPNWPAAMTVVNDALRGMAFDQVTKEADIPGGWTGIEATDGQGGHLRLETRDVSQLRAWVPIGGTC